MGQAPADAFCSGHMRGCGAVMDVDLDKLFEIHEQMMLKALEIGCVS